MPALLWTIHEAAARWDPRRRRFASPGSEATLRAVSRSACLGDQESPNSDSSCAIVHLRGTRCGSGLAESGLRLESVPVAVESKTNAVNRLRRLRSFLKTES